MIICIYKDERNILKEFHHYHVVAELDDSYELKIDENLWVFNKSHFIDIETFNKILKQKQHIYKERDTIAMGEGREREEMERLSVLNKLLDNLPQTRRFSYGNWEIVQYLNAGELFMASKNALVLRSDSIEDLCDKIDIYEKVHESD